MAKPQEILIPSYKDPERHSMFQSEKNLVLVRIYLT